MSGILDGKIALITGGTGGIGKATCKRLTKMGARVVSTYLGESKAVEMREQMKEQGCNIAIYPCDVSDFDQCQALADSIKNDIGPVDIVVNNAGITRDTTMKKMTAEQWQTVINNNLNSVFNVTRAFIESMLERQTGRVVNISSINGQKGQFGQANYSAAKAGIHGFTMALAQEVARKGITVNTVSPGYIATEMVMAVPEEVRNQIIAQIPVGRLGKPEEIAALIGFLASEDAAFITGANFAANGGQHMH
jgi:acetoacetyl-CoA reductase